jgi:hypothetical protein
VDHHDKPLKDLFRDLSEDSVRLVRQETALFKTEMKMRIEKVERDVAVLGAGSVLAYTGALVLTAAFILLLGNVMPLWVAAAIVGAAYAIAGAILIVNGKNKIAADSMTPRESIDSVRRDIAAIREART